MLDTTISENSKFDFYSFGIVAANKPLGTDIIEVTPIERFPMVDGELTDDTKLNKSKGLDASGQSYNTSVPVSNTIKATWLRRNTNRITSPDVRRGGKVNLYRIADQDKFYWESVDDEIHLRKLETVILGISSTKVETDPFDAEHTYYVEASTHQKHIRLHTTTKDGEPHEFDICLDTKNGVFVIQDDIGNSVSLDAVNHVINATNSDGSIVDLNKQDVTITAPGNLTLNVGGNFTVNASSTKISSPVSVDGDYTSPGNISIIGAVSASNI